jgi:hypothetical protein
VVTPRRLVTMLRMLPLSARRNVLLRLELPSAKE